MVFGLWFVGHYAVSAALHLLYAAFATSLFELALPPERRSTVRGYAFQRYPLEAALILAAFPAADTITWTFFQYLQLAAVCGVASVVLTARDASPRLRALGYACGAVATLLYEPFLCVMALLALNGASRLRASQRRGWELAEAALPGLFVAAVASKYLFAFAPQIFSPWLTLDHLPLVNTRAGRCGYMLVVFLANLARTLALPTVAQRGMIYELPQLFLGYIAELTMVAVVAVGALALRYARRTRTHETSKGDASRALLSPLVIAGLSLGGMFLMICGGRLAQPFYCTVQIRYAYVLFPFAFAALASHLRGVTPRARGVYAVALLYLVAVNAWSSANHVARVRREMAPITRYVTSLKDQRLSRQEIVTETERTLRERGLHVPSSDRDFIYNATDCLRDGPTGAEPRREATRR